MLVQNLAITYKCFSSIGTSLNLKEMMNTALKTFVSETYAIFGQYVIRNENNELVKLSQFGKIDNFNPFNYVNKLDKDIKMFNEEDRKVLVLKLDYGYIFLITKNLEADCSFFVSMFESFMQKINASIQACLNVQKMEETNKQLQQQKKELEEANKAKDDFMANMSHELKTPLNSINVISSVMKKNKDGKLNDKQIKNLEIINNCGNYLLSLINDVLDISKLEAGRINVSYSKVNLLETINDVYEMFLPQVKEKGSKLYFNYDKKINNIYSDDHKIKQIIKNLLSNALKFVGEGSIFLDVKDEDDYVTISVKDEGIGIDQDKLEHIFDRFKQADSSTTRKYGGTGLGLAICKELLDLLKGTIYVKSKVNEGTTFYITIPKNLDKLSHMDLLDIKDEENELPIISNDLTEKNKKDKILVYNTSHLDFFKLVITLQKDFEVIQTFKKPELLRLVDKDILSIIIDVDSINQDELDDIISSYSNRLIVLTEDSNLKLSNEGLEIKIIHKNDTDSINEQIKEYNGRK